MKKLLLTVVFCICLTATVYAENPVGVLFPKEYTLIKLTQNINIVTVNNSSWETVVKYHFGGKHKAPFDVLGFYLAYRYKHRGLISSYTTHTYWIFLRARYDKGCEHQDAQGVMEEVLGHELMHIINHQQKIIGNLPPYDIDGKDKPVK